MDKLLSLKNAEPGIIKDLIGVANPRSHYVMVLRNLLKVASKP